MSLEAIVPLTTEQVNILKKKRNAPSKKKIDEYVTELRKWLEQQVHLPQIDDVYLYKFLFGCKYNLEETKHRINTHFIMKSRHTSLFGNRDPLNEEQRELIKAVYFPFLPYSTKEGYRVLVGALADFNPENYNPPQILKSCFQMIDILLRFENEICASGLVIAFNGTGLTMKHVMRWNFETLKAVTDVLTKSRPESLKGIHIIESPSYAKPLFNIVKNLLNSKLRKRMSFNEPEVLYSQISKDNLPDELGGTAGPLEKFHSTWMKHLDDNREWLLTEGSAKADLSLLPGESEAIAFQDKFRKLDID